jgi:ATP-dependent DNA ligase
VATAWGAIVDGKRKEYGRTEDRPGSKGKEGTKAFMTAAQNAIFAHERAIRKKLEEGYVEVGLDGRPIVGGPTVRVETIDHSTWLPKNLCFSKPRNSMAMRKALALDEAGDLLKTRKMNGMSMIAHIDHYGMPQIYSRRMERLTYHFPHLDRALGPLGMHLPPCSILLFEAFLGEGNTKADLLKVQSVMRSLSGRACDLQDEHGFMKFYLYRVPVWKGEDIEKKNTCEQQAYLIENAFTDRFMAWRDEYKPIRDYQFLYTLQNFEGTIPEALAEAEEYGYEGWVCYQKSAIMGDYSYSFHGKPDRPSCCFKLKPWEEDDFICYWDPANSSKKRPLGAYGSGKNSERVGTLSLYQLNSAGEEIYICECAGMSDADRERLANPSIYPIVAEVKYETRTYKSEGDKTDALSHPRIARFRDDKAPEECVNESL